ncbi:MAG: mucoidy inhibitor MuiA family protein [Chitinophagaceae bacterium]
MKKILLSMTVIVIMHHVALAGDEKNSFPSTLQSATVYRSGAELVHNAKVSLKSGSNDLIIEGLSNALDINSVQIHTAESITILSVAFSADYLKPVTKSLRIEKLEDSLQSIATEKNKIQTLIKTDNELLDLLKANRELRGTQTGLSVAELAKMMDYYKAKTMEIQNELTQYREKENRYIEATDRIEQQIAEESQKNVKTGGRLILQVLSPIATNSNFTISYLTTKAYWNPYYDIRVENISKPISLLCKAKLVQTTGIDWKQVKLTLATSMPNQNSTAPVLSSWFLQFANPVARLENALYNNSIQSMLSGKVAGLSTSAFSEVVVTGFGKKKDEADEDDKEIKIRGNNSVTAKPVYVLNGDVISEDQFRNIDPKYIKSMDVLKDANATSIYGARASGGAVVVTLKEDLGDYITVKDNELNINYDIDIPYDVPGNGKEQNVSLKTYAVNTLYKYYAVPKLDKDAYLLGEIADWESLNLLPGEANIIFEGTYIGRTAIDPHAVQDTLNLTLGKDKRIVIKKEKVKDFSSVKFLGSNKKQTFTYEITVKNNKPEAVQMLLKDQYPLSTNKDIEVELLESADAVNNKDLGILTWKLNIAAGEQKKFRVSYSVKYPKDKYLNL